MNNKSNRSARFITVIALNTAKKLISLRELLKATLAWKEWATKGLDTIQFLFQKDMTEALPKCP